MLCVRSHGLRVARDGTALIVPHSKLDCSRAIFQDARHRYRARCHDVPGTARSAKHRCRNNWCQTASSSTLWAPKKLGGKSSPCQRRSAINVEYLDIDV